MTSGTDDLYEFAPCALLLVGADGRVLKVNATLSAWLGLTTEQLVGTKLYALLTVATRILFETNYAPVLSMRGSIDELSLDLRAADGNTVAVVGSGTIKMDADGRSPVTQFALVKASERRRYERELVDAREQSKALEEASQALLRAEREASEWREQFIAVLGHDLRNPLASISAGARLLQKDQPPERRTLLFEAIQGGIVRMSGLIDNVMDFARGRLGAGIPLDLRPDVLLTPILEQVVTELRLGLPDRAIETAFDLPGPIKCDPSRIGQLVSNLLGNALTHGAAEEPVRVHADSSGGALTIWVANGGEPIAPDALERLFQPFFRGDVRPSQQGLGLGLHIASEIAKAHGGTLEAASTLEETRFTFRMPLAA